MSFFGGVESFFKAVGHTIEKLFGKAGLAQTLSATITYVAPILNTILALADPAVAPLVAHIISIIQADLATVQTVIQQGTPAPGSPAEAAIKAALASVNENLASLLAMSAVKNSTKVSQITAAVGLITQETNAALGALETQTATATT